MKADLRFVFDTNVVISATLIRTSVSRQAFDIACEHGKLLVSLPIVEELQETLRRTKFDKYIREDERIIFLAALVRDAVFVEPTETILDCRDPKDNRFLEAAIAGNASCLVSGDADLLVLHPYRGIPVLTPRDFVNHDWKAFI